MNTKRLGWLLLFTVIIPGIALMVIGTFTGVSSRTDVRGDYTAITYFNLWGTPMSGVTTNTAGLHLSGPMSSSGKMHGEWRMVFDGELSSVWYWYGERISEGEWHLRNR